ncbi:uncharacterized protein BT62DRAFT_1002553 [Guyanagaster necrorhizus]|uniref:Uncharacterized protein n=1 Tax=Guyanagaster necrorhizus TaxID=856835 RepID=A0A9P7VZA5_9AGAR|nr:uncharacterized protein BT62DRAFT_1002553 [Guyanagaster necrorhizus MCA 3950]KAG7449009.1 hypothetical protein BT62DRAFT_1002553 [Guyanagaster necrorhizus MCA 3950]
MADNDEIDLETLQARIDLSMSFTHDLVSSWVKPSPNTNRSSSSKKIEKILQEELRRPPRLGVGASASDYNTLSSRETARLKGHLLSNGKKHLREDEGPQRSTSKHTAEESDEGESRAEAIRKKPKIDPFAGYSKEKRNKETLNRALNVEPCSSTPTEASSSNVGVTATEEVASGLVTSEKKRKKKHKNAVALASNDSALTTISTKSNSANDDDSVPETSEPFLLSPSRTLAFSLKTVPKIPIGLPTSLLKQPLLNLEGPVFDTSDDRSLDNHSPTDTPKKKKRRKRKKKRHSAFEGPSEQVKFS